MNKCTLCDGCCSHQRKIDVISSIETTQSKLVETFRVVPIDVWLIELAFEELKDDLRKKFEEVEND